MTFDPFNKEHVAFSRARDDAFAKTAGIELIPPSPDDIQFQFPDIRSSKQMPSGTMFMIPYRKTGETEEEWASRCLKISGIGTPVEP